MLGGWEIPIILIIAALLLFGGGKKIPEIARSIGRATGEFKRGQREVEREIKKEFSSQKKDEQEEDKVIKVAKELGIEIEGKSKEDLKKEIAIKLGDS